MNLLDTYQIMLNYQSMQTKQATKIFEALSSDVRLDLFRLLVKHAPDGLVQGFAGRAGSGLTAPGQG